MALNYKMKFNKFTKELEEIEGVQGTIVGNLENGNLELYRQAKKDEKVDLPFFAVPWQKIKDFDVSEQGTLSKKKLLLTKFTDGSQLDVEIQEKAELKSILADCIAFKKSAEEKFPKGATEKAVESLAKVSEALGEAFGKGLERAKGLGKGLKDKVSK
jgi:hypothetical protein